MVAKHLTCYFVTVTANGSFELASESASLLRPTNYIACYFSILYTKDASPLLFYVYPLTERWYDQLTVRLPDDLQL